VRAVVVEDEPTLRELVSVLLREEGLTVTTADRGATGIEMVRALAPDLVVLDVGLPDVDGFEVCRQIRSFSNAYVIMLTAKSDEIDKVVGLSLGADDYVTKPFSPRELAARVRAMLRRPRQQATGRARSFGNLEVDHGSRIVRVGGREVPLTRVEFDLLESLSSAPSVVLTRRQLLDRVWGDDWYGDEHVVDVHISKLRQKLEAHDGSRRYVLTVRGVGYRMGDGAPVTTA
jgi:DNA-binding response OmpR family regulator